MASHLTLSPVSNPQVQQDFAEIQKQARQGTIDQAAVAKLTQDWQAAGGELDALTTGIAQYLVRDPATLSTTNVQALEDQMKQAGMLQGGPDLSDLVASMQQEQAQQPHSTDAASGGSFPLFAEPTAEAKAVYKVQNALNPATGFSMGAHVDYDSVPSTGGLAGFKDRTGFVPSSSAGYVTAKGADGNFETAKALNYINDAINNGVPQVSLAITATPGAAMSPAQLAEVRRVVDYAKDNGVKLDIRYGYEMNGNWSPANNGGDPSIFKQDWAALSTLVRPDASMVWSPNVSSLGQADYEKWLPDDLNTIDKVGLDFYHMADSPIVPGEVSGALAGIYPLVERVQAAKTPPVAVPFTFSETGVNIHDGGSVRPGTPEATAMKQQWLDQLADPALQAAYPLYKGFTVFDYNKAEPQGGIAGNPVEHRAFAVSEDPSDRAMLQAYYNKNFAAKP